MTETMAERAEARADRLVVLDEVLRVLRMYELDPPVEDTLVMAEYVRNGTIIPINQIPPGNSLLPGADGRIRYE